MTNDVSETLRLATLDAYALMDSPREPHYDALVEQAAGAASAPIAMISLIDDTRQWFKAKRGVAHDGDPIAHSMCAHAIRGDDTLVVPDARKDDRFAAMAGVTGELGIRFYAGVPLRMRDGARLGTLCVVDVEPRAELEETERLALESLARRTVAAFELRRELIDPEHAIAGDTATLERALALLSQASAMLESVGATGPLAHLEQVVAAVDTLRLETEAASVEGASRADQTHV